MRLFHSFVLTLYVQCTLFHQGSINCGFLQSRIEEHGEYEEQGKDAKHQPDDLRHSLCDSKQSKYDTKHSICQPDDSKPSI